MRIRSVVAAVLASMVFPVAAMAAAPPSGLFTGYFVPKMVNNSGVLCMTDGANSTFSSSLETRISFPDIIYTTTGSVGPTAYRLFGRARMVFNPGSTTTGKVVFSANQSYPLAIWQPAFTAYSASFQYNPSQQGLEVHFKILFPGCTLPIDAIYQY